MANWDKLQFLIGSWDSPLTGQPGEAISGSSTFSYHLDRNILVRDSQAEFTPEPGQARGLVHNDLLIVYPQPNGTDFRAIYFDNEGHILHYAVTFPEAQPAVHFESEATTVSPRARLVYQQSPDGSLSVEFFVAFQGDELKSHVRGKLVRKA